MFCTEKHPAFSYMTLASSAWVFQDGQPPGSSTMYISAACASLLQPTRGAGWHPLHSLR